MWELQPETRHLRDVIGTNVGGDQHLLHSAVPASAQNLVALICIQPWTVGQWSHIYAVAHVLFKASCQSAVVEIVCCSNIFLCA